MEMEFTVKERSILEQILPVQGTFADLKIIRRLRDEFSLTEEERKEIGMREEQAKDPKTGEMVPTGRLVWDEDATLVKKIKVGDFANLIIVKALKKLSQEENLHLELVELYERFVERKEGEECKTKCS